MLTSILSRPGRSLPPSTFLDLHARKFGQWVLSQPQAIKIPQGNESWQVLWRQLAAEELYFAHCLGKLSPAHSISCEQLAEVQPFFPYGPTLSQLLTSPHYKQAWVATIPLDRPNKESGTLVRVWGIPSHSKSNIEKNETPYTNPFNLEGADLFPHHTIYIGGHPKDIPSIQGKSWQLGARLAELLQKEHRSDLLEKLATVWITSGEVHGDSVLPIELGNKKNMNTPHHQWLLPDTLREEINNASSPLNSSKISFCGDLKDAWCHLSGEGTRKASKHWEWPTIPGETITHHLCGKIPKPILAAIFALRPRSIYLWHSEEKDSIQCAKTIQEIIESHACQQWSGWNGKVPSIFLDKIPASDLPVIEEKLRSSNMLLPSELQDLQSRVVVNISGGNMLMKLATINVCRPHQHIDLLYKDFENFTIIQMRDGHSYSQELPAPKLSGIQWNYFNTRPNGETTKEMTNHIFLLSFPEHLPLSHLKHT